MNPHNQISVSARGFTLIEMTLSVALGALVVYVATAGIRTAAQGVASANRLALENSILRTGVVIALEQTDFWTSYDDPSYDPASDDGRIYRPYAGLAPGPDGVNRGLPFTPFITSRSSTGYGPTLIQSPLDPPLVDVHDTVKRGQMENASGWDPNAWQAAEARGWGWANQTERVPRFSSSRGKQVPSAKYKLFGRTEWFVSPEPDPSISNHHWQQRQLDGLNRSLGSYGLFDYLPANTGLMIYEKIKPRPNIITEDEGKWRVSEEWCSPDGGPYFRLASDGNLSFTLDRMADTWGNVFALPNRSVVAGVRSQVANRRYGTGIAIDASSNQSAIDGIKDLLTEAEQVERILSDGDATTVANKPAHWPSLTVSSLRFIRTGAFINLNRITWVSPFTGQGLELSFTCFGTTLRGARQQRKRDEPGWAEPFPDSGRPKHLDSYQ